MQAVIVELLSYALPSKPLRDGRQLTSARLNVVCDVDGSHGMQEEKTAAAVAGL